MTEETQSMRIAVPLAGETLHPHFGHCSRFALVDVDPADGTVFKREDVPAPPHQPGLFPGWLAKRRVNVVLTGSMGGRARTLLAERGITVVLGVPAGDPDDLIADYLAGTLVLSENRCDH